MRSWISISYSRMRLSVVWLYLSHDFLLLFRNWRAKKEPRNQLMTRQRNRMATRKRRKERGRRETKREVGSRRRKKRKGVIDIDETIAVAVVVAAQAPAALVPPPLHPRPSRVAPEGKNRRNRRLSQPTVRYWMTLEITVWFTVSSGLESRMKYFGWITI